MFILTSIGIITDLREAGAISTGVEILNRTLPKDFSEAESVLAKLQHSANGANRVDQPDSDDWQQSKSSRGRGSTQARGAAASGGHCSPASNQHTPPYIADDNPYSILAKGREAHCLTFSYFVSL